MHKDILSVTVKKLLTSPKGILAIDESIETCNKRFEKLNIPTTVENRRAYRELLVTAPEIEKYVSGFIIFDETFWQKSVNGKLFTEILKGKGIEPGIKVDIGAKDFALHPGEKITEGLDGLRDRLKHYRTAGASFAKWRAVITISDKTPTDANLIANADALSRYAALCQENDIVPIVEPEVLMDGSHDIDRCYEVTAHNLDILFRELKSLDVWIPGLILKTNMIVSGKDASVQATDEEVATMTLKCLKEHVPADIGGIVFLSGGQDDEASTRHLHIMHTMGTLPWQLTFSYGRAIQNEALNHFAKQPEDILGAQTKLIERCRANSLASVGKYV